MKRNYAKICAGSAWAGAMAFAFGAVALCLSGCRVGNYASPPASSADTVSGFYETAPQKVEVCATSGDAAQPTVCKEGNPVQVPSLLALTISNPVALIISDLPSGQAALINPSNSSSQLPLDVNMSDKQTLHSVASSQPNPLWADPACTRQLYVEQNGKINLADTTRTTNTGRKITGRLNLDVRMAYSFTGPCAESLAEMQACYVDRTQCGGSSDTDNQNRQAAVIDVFGDFIQAGAMTATDIGQVTSLGYRVTYQ